MKKKLHLLVSSLAVLLCAGSASAQTWTNSDLPAGDYVFQNVATGRYLGPGNSWGTQASLIPSSHTNKLASHGNGVYTIESQVSNGGTNYYFTGTYMDGSAVEVSIQDNGAGIYTLSTNGAFYGYNGADYVLTNTLTDPNSESAQWRILRPTDILLGAIDGTPQDVTYLIKDANFDRNNRNQSVWNMEATNKNLSGGDNTNKCAESYHAVFTLSQTISDAPNGVYSLTAQGFYRQDGADNDNLPVFYANDATATFPLKTGSENSMSDASVSFTAGKYTITPIYFEVTDGTITLGAKLEENTALWCIWDNFRLEYQGAGSEEATNAALAPIVKSVYEAALAAAEATGAQSAASKGAFDEQKAAITGAVDQTSATSLNEAANALTALVQKNQVNIDAYTKLNAAVQAYDITPYSSADEDAVNDFNTQLTAAQQGYAEATIATEEVDETIAALDKAYRKVVASQSEVGADVTEALVNATGNLGDSQAVIGWIATNTDGENFHINTWSDEGNTDGSNLTIPFVENWRWAVNGNLSDKTISQTIEGLQPGKYYSIEVLARLYSEAGATPDGVTFFANEESVPLTSGNFITNGSAKGYTDTYVLQAPADEQGNLTIGFQLESVTGNWLGFKNVKVTYIEKASPLLGAPRFTPAAGEISVGRIAGKGVTVKFGSASGLADLEQVIRARQLDYQVDFELLEDGSAIDTYTLTGTYSNDKTPTAAMFQDIEFEIGKEYEVRVNATKSKLINNSTEPAEEYVDSRSYSSGVFKVVLLAPGDYFIQNVESGNYLGGANSWGTRASMVKHGIDWGMSIKDADTLGDNVYVLDSKISNGGESHYFNGCGNDQLFVDQVDDNGSNGHNLGWTINSIGGGLYTIQNAEGLYLIEDGSEVLSLAELAEESAVKNADGTFASKAQWRMFNAEDLLTSCEEASASNPVDVTGLVYGANYSRNDQRNSAWQGSPTINGDVHAGFAAEKYQTSFDVYQTLTGLLKGAYEIHVQGYYRAGMSAAAKAAHEAGTEVLSAKFYATGKGSVEVPVMSIFDEFDRLPAEARNAGTENIPNSMSQGVYAFNANLYNHTFNATVGDDGQLTIGVKREGGAEPTANWTLWDNWEVYYLGAAETTLNDPGVAEVKLVASSNNSETAINDGDVLDNVTNDQLKNGLIIAFTGTNVKNAYNSAFRGKALIENKTTGEVVEVWANGDADNVISLARGYFGPNQEYDVTIEDVEYLDFTRFCDDPDLTPASPMYAYINAFALDENGDKIQLIGSDGTPRVDENGNPIYVKTHDACDPLPLWSGKNDGILPISFTIKTGADVATGDTSSSRYLVIRQGTAVVDEATAISNIAALREAQAIYTLAGQRVEKTQKGIYIIGGKKVVVK